MSLQKKRLEAYKAAQKEGAAGKKAAVKKSKSTSPTRKGIPADFQNARPKKMAVNGLLKETEKEKASVKAAKLLLLLGKDEAAQVLKHFSPQEVEGITRELIRIKQIVPEEAGKILREFKKIGRKTELFQGGPESARAILTKAFGARKGLELFNKYVPHGGGEPFAFLEDLEDQQVITLLKNETALTLSVVIPHLDAHKASTVLESLTPDKQKTVILRLGRMKNVSPEVIVKVEEILKDRIHKQGKVVTQPLNGKSALAEILKYMDMRSEKQILEDLEESVPHITDEIKEQLFTMDVLFELKDKDLQRLLRGFGEEQLALVLKGKEDEIKERLLSHVSNNRRIVLEEEFRRLGMVRKSEVDKATKEFLDHIRAEEALGNITLVRNNDTFV